MIEGIRYPRQIAGGVSPLLSGQLVKSWPAWFVRHIHVLISLGLFLGFLLLHLPFRSSYPVNWDAVQFALGVQRFDLQHHQPHPPGYIGYIALAKALNPAIHNPVVTLALISAISGALAPALFYPFARRFMPDRPALLATIAFGASALVWYYSEVALTYIVELAILMPFLLFIHRSIVSPDERDLLLASGMLAVAGSFRQTALVLMLPLWLYALWRHRWPARIRAGAALTGGVLIWLVPLLWLAGGPVNYLKLSRDLAEITGGNTSIFTLGMAGPAKNTGFVMAGLIVGVNVAAVVMLVGSPAIVRWLSSRSQHDHVFFALWTVPPLSVYLLGHTGQIGYVLNLLPIPFLGFGIALPYVAKLVHRAAPRIRAGQASAGLLALVLTANVAGFFMLPPVIRHIKPHSVALDVRQFDLPRSDAHWRSTVETIRNYPPDSSVVLTTIGGPRVSGSYRHLSFLLPEYHVYGLGRSLENGAFGPLFYAYQDQNNYEIEAMNKVDARIDLPQDIRYIIIPDAEITERLEPALEGKTAWTDQRGDLTVIVVDPGVSLVFSFYGDIITFSECGEVICNPAPGRVS